MDDRIVGIQMFEFDVPSSFHYEQGRMVNCRYGLLKITCSGQTGWGECIMSINEKHFDLIKWSTFLYKLRKLTIQEAQIAIELNRALWGKAKTELVEMALLDLTARLQKKKFNELIGLGVDLNKGSSIRTLDILPSNYSFKQTATSLLVPKSITETCHIHPGCKGTLLETVNYAQSLQQKGIKLLMHKDYLIGPACLAWQLAALGLGAEWLEVDDYLEPSRLTPLLPTAYGTGFQRDFPLLLEESQAYFAII
ncbi:hypothetical protein EHS13_07060 [Paenibacillus psychroresistens]|uniref:O-succinylbenzoate synthase n=1 Tax=Paenibacillus psychroresistens TaxID=1778678 RepID=A0A6B8RG08_9BACL|nr:hypothetical protein [Paenibacillus psychroresistens]QGQ94664.1 hypothetical protein EHS13_07060 [Paenibacillus psychroresistens]